MGAKPTARRAGNVRQQKKRSEAEDRNQRHRDNKALKAELRSVEKAWEKAEGRVAELQTMLSDPDAYQDKERAVSLAREHDKAKDDAAKLSSRWEELASQAERLKHSKAYVTDQGPSGQF